MPIIACPKCEKRMKHRPEAFGRITCSGCGTIIHIEKPKQKPLFVWIVAGIVGAAFLLAASLGGLIYWKVNADAQQKAAAALKDEADERELRQILRPIALKMDEFRDAEEKHQRLKQRLQDVVALAEAPIKRGDLDGANRMMPEVELAGAKFKQARAEANKQQDELRRMLKNAASDIQSVLARHPGWVKKPPKSCYDLAKEIEPRPWDGMETHP